VLGAFRVTARRRGEAVGAVYSGLAPDGGPVTLVLLGPGPSADAASRDRFSCAVAALTGRPGAVLADGSTQPWPWAALPPDASGDRVADGLLDAVVPAPAVGAAAARGPGFEPHWTGCADPPPWPPEPAPAAEPPAPADRTLWWVLGGVAALLALALVAVLGVRAVLAPEDPLPPASPIRTPTATPAPQPPRTQQAPAPSPSPDASAPPTATTPGTPGTAGTPGVQPPQPPPATSGSGVVGPSYTADDETREMRLEGLPFSFRVPPTWGCLRSATAEAPAVRYLCVDETWLVEGRDGRPPVAIIEVLPCAPPCGDNQWSGLRHRYAPDAAWRSVDAGTSVAEDSPPNPPGWYRVRMSRIFGAGGGTARPQLHVFVSLSGPADQVHTLRKILNDVRANTP
jgi:hypothetical protein